MTRAKTEVLLSEGQATRILSTARASATVKSETTIKTKNPQLMFQRFMTKLLSLSPHSLHSRRTSRATAERF
jgi:hypothetical protein